MSSYTFNVDLHGIGDTPEQAWQDVIAGFIDDPGPCPEDDAYIVDETYDE